MNIGGWVIGYLLVTVLIGLAAGGLSTLLPRLSIFGAQAAFSAQFLCVVCLFGSVRNHSGGYIAVYQYGILGVIEDPFGAFLCLILFAAFFVKKLYRRNLLTLGDLFRQAYGPKWSDWHPHS